MKARTPWMRTKRLAAWTITICLCLTMAGCVKAEGDRPVQSPEPPPTASAQADTTSTPTEEPSAADLWSDDRSRIDTPLLATAGLDAETQWEIFEAICGQDPDAFCALMAIAKHETDFMADLTGDNGGSVGMFQINTKWHTDRMERLGVTDLTDPVQSATVAVDLLRELAETFDSGISDTTTLMAYNMGPTGAKRVMDAGTYETAYTQEVIALLQTYLQEMEGNHD